MEKRNRSTQLRVRHVRVRDERDSYPCPQQAQGLRICLVAALTAACLVLLAGVMPNRAMAASDTISGHCEVTCINPQISGAAGGNVFAVSFPQYGIETTGHCISGALYGTPMPGTYPFTGTRDADGGYQITIDCAGAAMYPNHYSPYGPQNVGGFKIYLEGTIELWKHADAGYLERTPGASLAGAQYEIVDAGGTRLGLLTTNGDGWASASGVPSGNHVVREVVASPGFGLDVTEHTVTVVGGNTVHVNSDEPPLPQPEPPTEPEVPVVPVEPVEPEPPVEPDVPVGPQEPSEPEVPVTPDEPAEPEEPTTPDEPEEPTTPDKPTTPEEPTKPAEPETPVQPEEPTTPENPQQPDEPKPSEGDTTAEDGLAKTGSTLPRVGTLVALTCAAAAATFLCWRKRPQRIG